MGRLDSIELMVRQGKLKESAAVLEGISLRLRSRHEAAQFANLSWRSERPDLGIRVLAPIVRDRYGGKALASADELAEYVACLFRAGAPEEALALAHEVKSGPRRSSKLLLYEIGALVTRWDYTAAVAILNVYIEQKDLTDYQRLVGRVNLAAALVFLRRNREAESLLAELVEIAETCGHQRLLGNLLELHGIVCFWRKDWAGARAKLDRAIRTLSDSDAIETLFARKWLAATNVAEHLKDKKRILQLREIRSRSEQRRHWNLVRDCDRLIALLTQNKLLAQKVYLGSPYAGYRAELQKDFSDFWDPRESKILKLNSSKATTVLSIEKGRFGFGDATLEPGKALHRTLAAIFTEAYRPLGVAYLHFHIFPNEFYNPDSSPDRVHLCIRRLKGWCRKNQVPIEIQGVKGGYRVLSECTVEIPLQTNAVDRDRVLLMRLHVHFGGASFSSEGASNEFGKSLSSTQNILLRLIKNGWIRKVGDRKGARYEITSVG